MQTNLSKHANITRTIAVVNRSEELLQVLQQCDIAGHQTRLFKNGYDLYEAWKRERLQVSVVISCGEITGAAGTGLFEILTDKQFPDVPFIICASTVTDQLKKMALKTGIADVFTTIPDAFSLKVRLSFLIENWQQLRIKPSPIH